MAGHITAEESARHNPRLSDCQGCRSHPEGCSGQSSMARLRCAATICQASNEFNSKLSGFRRDLPVVGGATKDPAILHHPW